MEKKIHGGSKKCVSKSRQIRKRPGCIRLFVCKTTGGRMELSVSPRESILGLKTALARKLKTTPARIALIYKDTALTTGRLSDYSIPEDGQLTLMPTMETGISLSPSERSITQALENLSETQMNDFLCGRAPLMLGVRLGANMVFVQLQLSAASQQGQGQGISCSQSPQPTPARAVLSPSGISASALARASRCLSRRINQWKGAGRTAPHTGSADSTPSDISPSTSSETSASTRLSPSCSMSAPPSAAWSSSSPAPPPSSSSQQEPLRLAAPPTGNSATTKSLSRPSQNPAHPSPLGPNSAPCLLNNPQSSSSSTLQLPTSSPLSTPSSSSSSLPSPPPSPGAVINSLQHLGQGVYGGTFSGTLESSVPKQGNLQSKPGVSTILHILSDLLVATPTPPSTPTSPTAPHTFTPPAPTPAMSQLLTPPAPVSGSPLTPPASPLQRQAPGSFPAEVSDTDRLRGKMQRVQQMLALRKEERVRRRHKIADPYPLHSPTVGRRQTHVPTHTPSSHNAPESAPSTSLAVDAARSAPHLEDGMTTLEHESVAV